MAIINHTLSVDSPIEFPGIAVHRLQDHRMLVIAPEIPTWLALSPDEYSLFEQLLTSNTLGEVLIDRDTNSIQNLLGQFYTAGFFGSRRSTKHHRYVQFHVTNRCNLRCRHCYLDSGILKVDEMSFSQWCDIVDVLANDASDLFLSISGGEPLLQPYVPDLIRYARDRGVPEVAMISNGLLLTPELVDTLETSGLTNIALSLDGATRSVNDNVRGKGVFESVLKAFDLLAGTKIRVNVNITVMKMNQNDLEQNMGDLIARLPSNVDVSFGQFVPEGRGLRYMDELNLGYQSTTTTIANLGHSLSDTRFPISPTLHRSCGYGDSLVIYSNGDIAPCITPQFKRGNVLSDGMPALQRILTEAVSAQVDRLPMCRVCDLRYICGGKCHQHQIAKFGRALQNTCSESYRNGFYEALAAGSR